MVGIYFSGTGNTRYCVEQFLECYHSPSEFYSIEDPEALRALDEHQDILFAYPIYYSNLPKIVRDFLSDYSHMFTGKRVFVLITMGLFSGDGAGCAARLLKASGAEITGGLHVQMPDCISDEKALKRPLEANQRLVQAAREKVRDAAKRLLEGNPPQDGLSPLSHMAGLLGQRLWFGHKVTHYSDQLKLNNARCVGCGTCVALCPMDNLSLKEGKAAAGPHCTMCYRCVNHCPAQAITLLGTRVWEQYTIEHYTAPEPPQHK